MRQTRQTRKIRLSASATVMIVVVVAVCAGWIVAAIGDGWVGRCLRSRLTIQVGAIALVCLLGLYLLAGAAWRMRRSRRAGGEAGTAAIEFVLIFIVGLPIVLVMIQSVLLAAGNMAVHHAAYAAARSAVVRVPENLSYEEPRNVVAAPENSAKFYRIRLAAVCAVMPVSAGRGAPGGPGGAGSAAPIQEGMERFFNLHGVATPNWVQMLPGKYQYAWNYTEVSLEPPAGGSAYGDHETLRVRVRHALHLSVPYANRLFGRSLCGDGCGYYATDIDVTCSLTNQGVEDEIDVEQFPRYIGRGG